MALFVIQFYVIKNDKDKSLSKQILVSFRTNNVFRNSKPATLEETATLISKPSPMPFYSSSNAAKTRQRQLAAMMMLTGFRAKR
jgi:hypothetical protein